MINMQGACTINLFLHVILWSMVVWETTSTVTASTVTTTSPESTSSSTVTTTSPESTSSSTATTVPTASPESTSSSTATTVPTASPESTSTTTVTTTSPESTSSSTATTVPTASPESTSSSTATTTSPESTSTTTVTTTSSELTSTTTVTTTSIEDATTTHPDTTTTDGTTTTIPEETASTNIETTSPPDETTTTFTETTSTEDETTSTTDETMPTIPDETTTIPVETTSTNIETASSQDETTTTYTETTTEEETTSTNIETTPTIPDETTTTYQETTSTEDITTSTTDETTPTIPDVTTSIPEETTTILEETTSTLILTTSTIEETTTLVIDLCASRPCLNSGVCVSDDQMEAGFRCICNPGNTGQYCEIEIHPCAAFPCDHDSTCMALDYENFTCICSPGYTGITCDDDIDECESTPCQNGGSCTDQINHFQCLCRTDESSGIIYSGDTCEKETQTPPKFQSVYPNKGPIAGGTKLSLECRFYTFLVFKVFLNHQFECKVNATEQNGTHAFAITPTVNGELIDVLSDITVLFNNVDLKNQTLPRQFTYKGNPEIKNIQPTKLLDEGGTTVTVSGDAMDAVESPRLEVTVNKKFENGLRKKVVYGDCLGRNSTEIKCVAPKLNVNSTEKDWQVLPNYYSTDETNNLAVGEFQLKIGFILDGVDDFKDISKANNSELRALAEEFAVVDPPYIIEWTEEVLFDPKGPNTTLTIRGGDLTKAVSSEDYSVDIGEGACGIILSSFTDNTFECSPPTEEPSGADHNELLPVVVWAGVNTNYSIGFVKYEKGLPILLISLTTAGSIFLVVMVTVAIVVCQRRRNKDKDIPIVESRGSYFDPPADYEYDDQGFENLPPMDGNRYRPGSIIQETKQQTIVQQTSSRTFHNEGYQGDWHPHHRGARTPYTKPFRGGDANNRRNDRDTWMLNEDQSEQLMTNPDAIIQNPLLKANVIDHCGAAALPINYQRGFNRPTPVKSPTGLLYREGDPTTAPNRPPRNPTMGTYVPGGYAETESNMSQGYLRAPKTRVTVLVDDGDIDQLLYETNSTTSEVFASTEPEHEQSSVSSAGGVQNAPIIMPSMLRCGKRAQPTYNRRSVTRNRESLTLKPPENFQPSRPY